MDRDLVSHNPLAEELLAGVFEGGTTPAMDEYTVVYRSPDGGSRLEPVKRLSRY